MVVLLVSSSASNSILWNLTIITVTEGIWVPTEVVHLLIGPLHVGLLHHLGLVVLAGITAGWRPYFRILSPRSPLSLKVRLK
jgi:hypothetical protein